MGTLEPRKKIRSLRKRIFSIRDRRVIKDKLIEIEREVIALEVQNEELREANQELVRQANVGRPDPEVAF